MKNDFQPGDPVLIINGRDAKHLANVGKASIVTSPYIHGSCVGNLAPTNGFLLDLCEITMTRYGPITDLLYRHKDLMPINPIYDEINELEVTNEQETTQVTTRNTEASRHL